MDKATQFYLVLQECLGYFFASLESFSNINSSEKIQPKPAQSIKPGTAKRLLKYILKGYKLKFFVVLICIIFASIASVASSLFLKTLIDGYIMPLLEVENPVYTELLKAIRSISHNLFSWYYL